MNDSGEGEVESGRWIGIVGSDSGVECAPGEAHADCEETAADARLEPTDKPSAPVVVEPGQVVR